MVFMILILIDIWVGEYLNKIINMRLKLIVLASTILIFFIRIFWKESTDLLNKNFDYLFGITLDKLVIYVYQIIVILSITSIKKINLIILILLLLINLLLITFYLVNISELIII